MMDRYDEMSASFIGRASRDHGTTAWRWCPMQPPPLAAQFEDRRGGKPRQRLRDINQEQAEEASLIPETSTTFELTPLIAGFRPT